MESQPWWLSPPVPVLLLALLAVLICVLILMSGALRRERRSVRSLKVLMKMQLAVLDAIPMPVYLRDRRLNLTVCNSKYMSACGRPRTALRNTSLDISARALGASPSDIAALHRDYLRVMESDEPLIQDRTLTTQEEKTVLRHWIAPLHDASAGVAGIVGGWIDVTDRHRALADLAEARDRAEAANRAKSTFLASVSHDIRTPMNAIMGMLELTLLQTGLPAHARQQLEMALQSARSLLSLIGDLLDLSKMEAGKFQLQPCPTSLHEVVHEVAGVFAPVAHSNGVVLEAMVAPSVAPSHLVDPLRLKQVLNNVVSNAVRFTRQGHIRLEVKATPEKKGHQWVEFTVSDTGIGISRKTMPALFEPFVQEHPEIGDHGVGLGLSICKRLVDKMEGVIRIESKFGHGTRVVTRLPLRVVPDTVPHAAGPSAHDGPDRDTGQDDLPILVVDDQPSNRLLIQFQLRKLGYKVVCAEDGLQALAVVAKQPFQLVICDCAMPEMDGFAFTRALRAQPGANAAIPVLAYTAGAQEADVQRALAAGMNAVLIKPVSMADLQAALHAHLPRPGPDRR
ncbi:hypothetical protein BPNSA17_11530 [Bordetella petrii]